METIIPAAEGAVPLELPIAAQRIDVRVDIGRHTITNEIVHGVAFSQFVDGQGQQPNLRVVSTYKPDVARQIANSILELCDGLDAAAKAGVGVVNQFSDLEQVDLEHIETEGDA